MKPCLARYRVSRPWPAPNSKTLLILWDLNIFAEFTLRFSNESPLLYGAFAIILAIALGALAAWMRKFMSPVIKKLLSDFRNKDQQKKEEVKFPEK